MMLLFFASTLDLSLLDCFMSPTMSRIFSLNCVGEVVFLPVRVVFHFLMIGCIVVGSWVIATTCTALIFCDVLWYGVPPPVPPPPPGPLIGPHEIGAGVTVSATGNPTAKSEK